MMIDDGKLNKKHNYFFQIQGQLFVTKRKYCDFIVWTPKGINVEIIVADDQFIKNILPKLKDFYYKHYSPKLVDSRHERRVGYGTYFVFRGTLDTDKFDISVNVFPLNLAFYLTFVVRCCVCLK
jgi:hypothetical protein